MAQRGIGESCLLLWILRVLASVTSLATLSWKMKIFWYLGFSHICENTCNVRLYYLRFLARCLYFSIIRCYSISCMNISRSDSESALFMFGAPSKSAPRPESRKPLRRRPAMQSAHAISKDSCNNCQISRKFYANSKNPTSKSFDCWATWNLRIPELAAWN